MTDEKVAVAIDHQSGFMSSSDLGELFGALAKAQGSMEAAKKDTANPFFKSKYADLASCWEVCRKPLSEAGLSIVQLPQPGKPYEYEVVDTDKQGNVIGTRKAQGFTVRVLTILGHSSGQWISGLTELKPVKTDPQGVGSAMTYARRYGLMAIVGIAPDDDDGNAASGRETSQEAGRRAQPTGSSGPTQPQLKRLFAIAHSRGVPKSVVVDTAKKRYKVEGVENLSRDQYQEYCTSLEKMVDKSAEPEQPQQ